MARKWTKLKAWSTCKVVVLFIKPIAFSRSRYRHRCRCLSSLMFLTNNRIVSRTNTCSTLAQEREKKEKERQTSSLPDNVDDDHNCMCDWGVTAAAERRRSQDINKRKRFLHCLPHLVLDTLTEPAAQQGGGIFPPQHDFLSVIVELLYIEYVDPPWVIVGICWSKSALYSLNLSRQLISVEDTPLSATLSDAVSTTGILKNTLLTPGGDATMFSMVMFTSLHSNSTFLRLGSTEENMSAIEVFFCAIVSLLSPPGIL